MEPGPATLAVSGIADLPLLVERTIFEDGPVLEYTASGLVVRSVDETHEARITGEGLVWELDEAGEPFPTAGTVTGVTFGVVGAGGVQTVAVLSGLSIPATAVNAAVDADFDNPGFERPAFWNLFAGIDVSVTGSSGEDEVNLGPLGAGDEGIALGDGDDFIVGSAGNDTLDGGDGFDQAAYHRLGLTGGITANLGEAGEDGSAAANDGSFTDTLRSIEALRGTEGADSLTGNSGNNMFRGLAGNDTIDGGAGRDQVRYDRDAADGGTGGVNVNLATGVAIDGFGHTDSLTSIERVLGSAAADTLTGGAGDDELSGGAGNDILDGGAGNDTLTGGAGQDTFVLSGGQDVITDFDFASDDIDAPDLTPEQQAQIVANAQDVTVEGQAGVVLDLGGGQTVTFVGYTADQFQTAFAANAPDPLLDAVAQAGTLSQMEGALAAFAADRGIVIPEGMLPALAGDVLLNIPATYSLSFTTTVVDGVGSLANNLPESINGTISFRLPFVGTEDQLADAILPQAVFQYAQPGIPGNALDLSIPGLRLSITSLRLENDEITQQEIDELGTEGIEALFGTGAVVEAGQYTTLQLWLSAAVGEQDPVTGEFSPVGLEVSIDLFMPGQLGLEAFLDVLASGVRPLAMLQVTDFKLPDASGDDTAGDITAAFDTFEVTRTPGEADAAALTQGLTDLIAVRSALEDLLAAANAGTLGVEELAALGAALPEEPGAAPFLSGEQLSVAALNALTALGAASDLVDRLAAFNADPDRPALDSLTDLMASPVLFPDLNPDAGGAPMAMSLHAMVFGDEGADGALSPNEVTAGDGEEAIDLTGSPGPDLILYLAGMTGGQDTVSGFDTGADRIGYAAADAGTLSLTRVTAASDAPGDLAAALGDFDPAGTDVQFVLVEAEGAEGPLLVALTDAGSPDTLAVLRGVDPAAFTLENLLLSGPPVPEV